MYKDLLAHSPLLALPIAALLIFLAVFLAVCVRAMTRKPRDYAPAANLPLEEDCHE
jgi:hypothetical protein